MRAIVPGANSSYRTWATRRAFFSCSSCSTSTWASLEESGQVRMRRRKHSRGRHLTRLAAGDTHGQECGWFWENEKVAAWSLCGVVDGGACAE